jgi:long-chain acyl-CoA synthetase
MITTLGEIAPIAAARYGDKLAAVVDGATLTFDALEERSNAIANGLIGAGVQPGDRVVLYGPNACEWLIAYCAIAKVGAVVVPVNALMTATEVAYVVEHAGARVLLAETDKGASLLDRQRDLGLTTVVLWGAPPPKGETSLDFWQSLGATTFTPVTRAAGDTGAICYTSGTTGRPKGAAQNHRAIVMAAMAAATMSARTRADTVVSPLPLPHVYGSCVLNAALLAGSTLVSLSRFDVDAVLDAVRTYRATVMDGVPTAYYYMLAHPRFGSYDLRSLTRCTVGGQTLPAAKSLEFSERTGGVPVHELWGMTELAGAATFNPYWGLNKPGTIGLPVPGMQVRIVDAADPGKEMGVGERGELMVKGPMVMQGYTGDETATREAIRPDGWMHTGDIATMDEDGYCTIVDRKKDMILTAGYNVYPAEVERVLCMHPAVALAAVCGVADETKGELAKAYVMVKPGAGVTGRELVEHCRAHLAAYKLPRAVQLVENVPITSSGKILRRLLKDVDDGRREV